jgi:hypothetical protein
MRKQEQEYWISECIIDTEDILYYYRRTVTFAKLDIFPPEVSNRNLTSLIPSFSSHSYKLIQSPSLF